MPSRPHPRRVRRAHLLPALVLCLLTHPAVLASSSLAAKLPTAALVQLTPLPSGMPLPVQLTRSLRAGHVKVGESIIAKTTQRVPVSPQLYLPAGAELFGKVTASASAAPGKAATLSLRFTAIRFRGQTLPVTIIALAIANFTDVADTRLPLNAAGRGNSSPAGWTTRQIGGDEVARSGWIGEVINTQTQTVGFADYLGVYALPAPVSDLDPSPLPGALGVFSSSASGLYGFDQGSRLESGAGTLTLTRPTGRLQLRNGDNLLLKVL